MKPTYPSRDREKIVADAIWPVASELRMIDVVDLISMLRFERYANLADIVATASELYYLPDTVKLGSAATTSSTGIPPRRSFSTSNCGRSA